MILAKNVAFAFLEKLHNLVSMQNLCLQVTAEISKIRNSVRCDMDFIFIELLETPNSFVKLSLILEMRKVVSFIKTRFFIENEVA